MTLIEQGRYDGYNKAFRPLRDEDVLWRYMDLTNLMSLLEFRALHFRRADLLGDPFEGSLSAKMIEPPSHTFENGAERKLTRAERSQWLKARSQMPELRHALRRWTWISCWTRGNSESEALWGRYVPAEGSIAIRSTFGRLTRCFGESLPPLQARSAPTDDVPVYVGQVAYVNYKTAVWPRGDLFWPFMHKRHSFAHDAEVRAVIMDFPREPEALEFPAQTPASRSLAVNLGTLIKAVHVSPVAPVWLFELVRSICARYGLKAAVRQSRLSPIPRT